MLLGVAASKVDLSLCRISMKEVHCGSIMVWGCVSGAGMGKLKRLDGKSDAEAYYRTLRQQSGPTMKLQDGQQSFIFIQDNAFAHTAGAKLTNNLGNVRLPQQKGPQNLIGLLPRLILSFCVKNRFFVTIFKQNLQLTLSTLTILGPPRIV